MIPRTHIIYEGRALHHSYAGLSKIASAGQNGQFRTTRHIIRLMVELTAPKPGNIICAPAAGTCGFLRAAVEYLREHFHHGMFHGFDFDNTMLRIGSINMLLHGVISGGFQDLREPDHRRSDWFPTQAVLQNFEDYLTNASPFRFWSSLLPRPEFEIVEECQNL